MKPAPIRPRFKKKADSLDISRYGLWGDAPPEIMFFIIIILLNVIAGFVVEKIRCINETGFPIKCNHVTAKKIYHSGQPESRNYGLTLANNIKTHTQQMSKTFFPNNFEEQIDFTIIKMRLQVDPLSWDGNNIYKSTRLLLLGPGYGQSESIYTKFFNISGNQVIA